MSSPLVTLALQFKAPSAIQAACLSPHPKSPYGGTSKRQYLTVAESDEEVHFISSSSIRLPNCAAQSSIEQAIASMPYSGVNKGTAEVEVSYTCQWRKPTTKKRKTWEGDGILKIMGNRCSLIDADSRKPIASGNWKGGRPEFGDELSVGGKEIEIDSLISSPLTLSSVEVSGASSSIVNISDDSPYLRKIGSFAKHRTVNAQPKPIFQLQKQPNKTIDIPKQPSPSTSPPKKNDIELKPTNAPRANSIVELNCSRYFTCLYRKPTPKKNKSWEGDGILNLSADMTRIKLQDQTSKKDVDSCVKRDMPFSLAEGSEFRLTSREVKIVQELTPREFQREFEGDGTIIEEITKAPKPNAIHRHSVPMPKGKENDNPLKFPILVQDQTTTSSVVKPRNIVVPVDTEANDAMIMTRPDVNWLSSNNPKNHPVTDVVIEPSLAKLLRPHQVDGVRFMYSCAMGMNELEGRGCILADEMGLGKSIQAITLIWTLLRQNPLQGCGPVIERAMIVCPVSLIKNWAREIKKWLPGARLGVFLADSKSDLKHFTFNKAYKILIIGYEKLRTVASELKSIYPPIGLIIADEGHRLKSAGTKTTQAFKLLKTTRRIVLSGTPVQNNLGEYFSMVDFVNPGTLDDYKTFKKTFEQPILKSREPGCSRSQRELGYVRADQLAQIAHGFVLRRTSEVISHYLPPKRDFCVFVVPTVAQRKIYAAILESPAVREIFSGHGSKHLVLINALRKLCNSAGLLGDEDSIQSLKTAAPDLFPRGFSKNDLSLSGKFSAIARFLSILKRDTDEKIILVSNSTSALNILESHCENKRYTYCRLDGSTPQTKRDQIVQTFNRSSQTGQFIFLLSSKAGGTGLNLIGASRLILYDSDWNPATDLQAMARIWRQGQKRPCFIYRFLTTGTLEECIYQRQITKQGLAGDMMNDPTSALGKRDAFSLEELRALFRLQTDTPCATHDLLACNCRKANTGEEVDLDGGLDDLDELPNFQNGFVRASQVTTDCPSEVSKPRKHLAELHSWLHVDTAVTDSIDELDEPILVETINGASNTDLSQVDEGNSNGDYRSATNGYISFVFSKTTTAFDTTA